ncbi:Polyglutamine-binding protein 1 [Amphibalanus amphitrite]|uniref:Polyglutamine-binding protein 1 n=1 Tax=Amphibalanus amphitrite TaxID=1232801 RepID=A0A6A4WY96_AMPAM|nr:Polyglutamine-binding protein 1 [Amphibalanus amphitrite]
MSDSSRKVKPQQRRSANQKDTDEEEVIAEDYDDHGATDLQLNYAHNKHGGKLVTDDATAGALGCPNKWNVYHECSAFCQRRWGAGQDPDPRLELKRLRMLEKYPLPAGWSEVYDPGTGRYYYWNTETEVVSWLPPGHPRARPGACAAALRLQLQAAQREGQAGQPTEPHTDTARPASDQEMSDDEHDRERQRERDHRRERERRPRERAAARARKRPDELDPMDPAAYSDIPRGSWSAGLERDVKSGVDATASGPLFQQRPYPSPGAVLRANAASRPADAGDGQ